MPIVREEPEELVPSSHLNWTQVHQEAQKDWCSHLPPQDKGCYICAPSLRNKENVGYLKEYTYLHWHHVLPPVVRTLQRHGLPLIPDGDIYGFGVAQGESMKVLHEMFPKLRIFGFDSFAGLPKETHKKSVIKNWGEGYFGPKASPEDLVKSAGGPEFATVTKGFFDKTLTTELMQKKKMGPAFYVDIDCDLYVSTYPVLDFLFKHNIVRVGTLIGYDDWWTIPCRHAWCGTETREHLSPMSVGEGLAQADIAIKYGVSFRCVAGPCAPVKDMTKCHLNNNWGPVFLVEAIAGSFAGGSHGFRFTSQEEADWMQQQPVCRFC